MNLIMRFWEKYWGISVKNKYEEWISLIEKNTKKIKSINVMEYLKDKISNDPY